jgi:aerobic-type carbon monoxide dehydrogenase small subunit (CoxS/CutS family)
MTEKKRTATNLPPFFGLNERCSVKRRYLMIRIFVNGKKQEIQVDPDTPLLWVLRDHLGLTGTKYSCGIGECGACTVHVEGEAVLSCTIPLKEVAEKSITTIEGLESAEGRALKRNWIEEDVPQCGFCQPGQIMTAAALLHDVPNPSEEEINRHMSGVLCRCGTYEEVKKAIRKAAGEVSHEKE